MAFIERKYPDLIDFPQELSNVEIGAKVSDTKFVLFNIRSCEDQQDLVRKNIKNMRT